MTTFPPPIVEVHERVFVVREDAMPGGTKRRFVDPFVAKLAPRYAEFVYATTAYGGAQIALAHACAQAKRRAVVFVAKRDELHARTLEAKLAGAAVIEVPMGFLSNVQAKARAYCALHPRSYLMPFGFDSPEARSAIAAAARDVRARFGAFGEVWCAAGSGTLIRALRDADLGARYVGIAVGRNHANEPPLIAFIRHKQPFGDDAKAPPPFASCSNYDAKVWVYVRERARRGVRALFWNVMG